MAFKPLAGGDRAPIHNLIEDGPLVGTYVRTDTINTKFGEKPLHVFAVAGGAESALFGNFRINDAVETVKDENPPVILRISDPGTKSVTTSGNFVRDIQIEVSTDEEDLALVSSAPAPVDDDDV
jgi:hypothetical protein